ncbi:MAG: hypothetical protein IJ206_13015 [Oscillospiraceae bacterium]|nr:hypothetical protein [Oscillospiraceae bacterium]
MVKIDPSRTAKFRLESRAPGSAITEQILFCIGAVAMLREAGRSENMIAIVVADISSAEPVFEVVELTPDCSLEKMAARSPAVALYTTTMPVLGDPQAVYRVFNEWRKCRAQYKRELAARLDNDGPINPALFQDPRDTTKNGGDTNG